MARKTDPETRFWRHVRKTETCWLWTGGTAGSTARYPMFWSGSRKVYAHRWSYERFIGPIPEGLEIDHVAARGCTSKLCVNPAHLEPVTHGENRERGRLRLCRRGLHDLDDPVNQRWDSQGNRRGCQRCWLDRAKERYAREVRI